MQQRANWALLQGVIESEYERGFRKGVQVGRAEMKAALEIVQEKNA